VLGRIQVWLAIVEMIDNQEESTKQRLHHMIPHGNCEIVGNFYLLLVGLIKMENPVFLNSQHCREFLSFISWIDKNGKPCVHKFSTVSLKCK
jgi:hypothetical protein